MSKSSLKLLKIACVASAFVTVPTFAGGYTDGGGVIQYCPGRGAEKAKVELLDLYEARNVYGLSLEKRAGDFNSVLKNVFAKVSAATIQPEFHLAPNLALVQNSLRFLSAEIKPIPTNDLEALIEPESGCRYSQIARFTEDNILLVNQRAWNEMDELNKAALMLHEAVYLLQRKEGATSSRKSRKVVAYAFSSTQLTPVALGIPSAAKWCWSYAPSELNKVVDSFAMYPHPEHPNLTVLQYKWKDGHYLYSRTSVVIPWSSQTPSRAGYFAGGKLNSQIEGSMIVSLGYAPGTDAHYYISTNTGDLPIKCEK